MKPLLQTPLRAAAALACVLASFAFATASLAQPAAATAGTGAAPASAVPAAAPLPKTGGRPDQAIERITTEDAGSRIDELRVGGETKNITVQPKTGSGAPAYEVRPDNAQTTGPGSSSSSGNTTGSRVWNIFKF